jgi:hypothetical protein
VFGHLVEEAAGGEDVEHARLQRDDHPVGELEHLGEHLAVHAGRRVQHHMRRALGRLGNVPGPEIPGTDRPGAGRPQSEPQLGRLLAVRVPEHYGVAEAGKIPCDVGRNGGLSDTAFWIGDNHDRHEQLLVFGTRCGD